MRDKNKNINQLLITTKRTGCWVKTSKDFISKIFSVSWISFYKDVWVFLEKNIYFKFTKYVLVPLKLDWLSLDWYDKIIIPDYRTVELHNDFKYNHGIFNVIVHDIFHLHDLFWMYNKHWSRQPCPSH